MPFFVNVFWIMFIGLPNYFIIVNDYGLAPKLKPFPQLNELIKKKCFDKINENVGVNRAPVRIRHSGRAGDSGRDTFENKNLTIRKIKEINQASPGFRFGFAFRVGTGSGVATSPEDNQVSKSCSNEYGLLWRQRC